MSEGKPRSARGRKFEAKPEIIPKSKAAAVKAQEAKALEAQKQEARAKRWAEQRAGAEQRSRATSPKGNQRGDGRAEKQGSRDSRGKRPARPSFSAQPRKDFRTASADTPRRNSKTSSREIDPNPPGTVAAKPPAPATPAASERIAKVIARAGLCSRRDAENYIEQGRVSLNGAIISSPALNVSAGDDVRIDGNPLGRREKTRLFLFHKPRGLVTTDRDPEGRPTVFEHLRKTWPAGPRVMSIGRLDINTEGLLLLTNDGGLARVLELPSTGWTRRYRVRANGKTDQAVLDSLRGGVTIDGIDYAGIEAALDRQQGANVWLTMSLREGKNREVKKVLEHIGLFVNRLIRLSFGPFQLGELEEGAVSEVKTRILAEQLGPALSESAGADFLSPLLEELEKEAQVQVPAPLAVRSQGKALAKQAGVIEVTRSRDTSPKTEAAQRQSRRQSATKVRLQPEEDRPKLVRPLPGPRKHISALREAVADMDTPRQRITRETATDRKGRTIAVERVSNASGEKSSSGSNRNKNRFENEKRAAPVPAAGTRQRQTPARTQGTQKPRRTEKPKFYSGASAAPRFKPDVAFTGKPVRGAMGKRPRKILQVTSD